MVSIKKYRHKPVYKKFVNLKVNVQNRQKLLKFKKQKWKNLLFKLNKTSKKRKRNCYYKFYDQNSYNISKYNNYFSRNYKQDVQTKKMFNLFYGNLNEKYLKSLIKKSVSKSNQIKNNINLKIFFTNFLEKRIDVILVRSHFVLSIRNARQLVSHGHIMVNGKIITDNSFTVKKGDCITFSSKIHNLIQYYLVLSDLWPLPPGYLQVNYKLFSIHVLDDIMFSNNFSKIFLWLNLNSVIKSYNK